MGDSRAIIYEGLGEKRDLSMRLEYLSDGSVREFPTPYHLLLVRGHDAEEPKLWYEDGYDPDNSDQIPVWLPNDSYAALFLESRSVIDAMIGYEYFYCALDSEDNILPYNPQEHFYLILRRGIEGYNLYKRMLLAREESFDFDKHEYLRDLLQGMLTGINTQRGPAFHRLVYASQGQFLSTVLLAQVLESSNLLVANMELTLVGKELRRDFSKVLGTYGSNKGFLEFVRDFNTAALNLMGEYEVRLENQLLVTEIVRMSEELVEDYWNYRKRISMTRALDI